MSLRHKLIVWVAAGVALTFLLGAGLIYFHAIDKIDTEMQAAIAVGSRITANAVDDAEEITNAAKRLELLVKDFDGDRHLQALALAPDGRVLNKSSLAPASANVPEWFYRLFAGRDRRVIVSLPKEFDQLGRLALETSSRNEIGEVWDDTIKTATMLAILTVFISSAVYWIIGSALRPLDRLATAFGQVGKSAEPNYVPESGPEEFIRVYRAFNRMVERQDKSEATNRKLHQQLLEVQDEERADIARDLHDEIGPFLFNVDVETASILKLHEDQKHQELPARIKSIREAVSHMQRHVRGILSRLRPAALLDLGLRDALEHLVDSWRTRHPAITFALSFDVPPLDEQQEDTIFRITQEAINNAVRHGQPGRIDIAVHHRGDTVQIEIADNGRGFCGDCAAGFGIRGMRERVALHDGQLEIARGQSGVGAIVRAQFPDKIIEA